MITNLFLRFLTVNDEQQHTTKIYDTAPHRTAGAAASAVLPHSRDAPATISPSV
jgi:hypothetical protein